MKLLLRVRILEWSGIAFLVAGCGIVQPDQESKEKSAPAREQSTAEIDGTPEDVGRIKAGFGLPKCYIGMSSNQLDSHWKPLSDFTPDVYLRNQNGGMDVRVTDGLIDVIFFYFLSTDTGSYVGATDRGINANSSIDDVKSLYGDPSYIGRSIQSEGGEFPGEADTSIDYLEAGIRFQFIGDRLAMIAISQPKSNFDYEDFGSKMKDWLLYIRRPNESSGN